RGVPEFEALWQILRVEDSTPGLVAPAGYSDADLSHARVSSLREKACGQRSDFTPAVPASAVNVNERDARLVPVRVAGTFDAALERSRAIARACRCSRSHRWRPPAAAHA